MVDKVKKGEERFEISYYQEKMLTSTEIMRDKETGVNYLCFRAGGGVGITVLVDSDGKPIVTEF